MKKGDYSQWEENKYYSGVLLFAQTLEECLFHFSYESYRMPALNAHHLCYDVIWTAGDIERKVLSDGNFLPLSEEFEYTVQNDFFIKNSISSFETLFLMQGSDRKFFDLTTCDLKTKIKYYPEIASLIKNICEVDSLYIDNILSQLIGNIFVDDMAYENYKMIYLLARCLATELVNNGYSKEYLYVKTLDYFFNIEHAIKCEPDTIVNFFNLFTFEEHTYNVSFGTNKRVSIMLKEIGNISINPPTEEERGAFNLQHANDLVATFSVKSIDPYSAFEEATHKTNTIIALHRLGQHSKRLFISYKALVSEKISNDDEGTQIQTEKNHLTNILISSPIDPMQRINNNTYLHALFNDLSLLNMSDEVDTFFRAAALHNGAVESKDISNQLLNLWTSLETLIDTRRDSEDRINTISTVLCAILNRCYIYSQIEQLLKDIEACATIDYQKEILSAIGHEYEDQELDAVEKTALLLSIDAYKGERTRLIEDLNEYPILQYRINMFATEILKDSSSIYKYLVDHSNRIRWHIMRIYRNRNMIVHSGYYLPYRNMIIENLHYYVDTLLDTIIEYYNIGMSDHQSIYKDIINEEMKYYTRLGVDLKKNNKKVTNKLVDSENALSLIFNGYSGNIVKKAISRVELNAQKREHEKAIQEHNTENS